MRPAVSRVRLTFAKGPALRYIGHLDLARAWERALRRADLPVAWTQGFTPRIRLAFAAPLALGTVGEREVAEVFLHEAVEASELIARLGAQLPPGCTLMSAVALPVAGSSLASLVRWARYDVSLWQLLAAPEVDTSSADAVVSQWSRRVPDDASISTTPAPDESAPSNDLDVPPIDRVDRASGGERAFPPASAPHDLSDADQDEHVSDPFRSRWEGDETPLRPRAQWLPPEATSATPPDRTQVNERLRAFLAATSVMVQRTRDGRSVMTEARGAVDDAFLLPTGDGASVPHVDRLRDGTPSGDDAPRIALVVRHDATGAGRPEDVAAALGYEARSIVRRAIGLEGDPYPRRDAW